MQAELNAAILGVIQSSEAGDADSLANAINDLKEITACRYCGGLCDLQPPGSEHLCDGYAGDVDGLYAIEDEWPSASEDEKSLMEMGRKLFGHLTLEEKIDACRQMEREEEELDSAELADQQRQIEKFSPPSFPGPPPAIPSQREQIQSIYDELTWLTNEQIRSLYPEGDIDDLAKSENRSPDDHHANVWQVACDVYNDELEMPSKEDFK